MIGFRETHSTKRRGVYHDHVPLAAGVEESKEAKLYGQQRVRFSHTATLRQNGKKQQVRRLQKAVRGCLPNKTIARRQSRNSIYLIIRYSMDIDICPVDHIDQNVLLNLLFAEVSSIIFLLLGSGPKGADDLCFPPSTPPPRQDSNPSLKALILVSRP